MIAVTAGNSEETGDLTVDGVPSEHSGMLPRPLVSIALATYNGIKYIEELLASIEAQDYANLEIVISDDGSTDGTLALLASRKWQRPHRVLIPTSRAGVIGNFARALGDCRGRYLALSDQDDYWMPNKISALVDRIEQVQREAGKDTPAVVFSDIQLVDETLKILAPSFFDVNYNTAQCRTFADFLLTNHVPGCALLFNRELLERASPIPTDFHMHDWWLMITAAAFGRIDFVNMPLMKYRQHANNVIGTVKHRSSTITKLGKVFRIETWKAWLIFIIPKENAITTTVRNVRRIELRFGHLLPANARSSLHRLRASRLNVLQAVWFAATTRTGERFLYSVALLHLAAKRLGSS